MTDIVSVAICSRYPLTTCGLEGLLAGAPQRVAIVDLLPSLPSAHTPQVVLYDAADLHDRGSAEGLHRLLRRHRVPVIAITPHGRPDLAQRALGSGAAVALDHTVTASDLLAAIVGVVRDDADGVDRASVPTTGPGTGLATGPATGPGTGLGAGLSPREVAVVTLMSQGLSNREIAEELDLSLGHVTTSIRTAYRRIGVTSRAQAVLWALEHDTSSPSDPRRVS